MARERVHAVVSGEVQGVGYRWFVQRLADSMLVDGWVKNLPNGDVELEAEADKDTLDSFIGAIQRKHSWARIDNVNIEPVKPYNAEKSGFKIIY